MEIVDDSWLESHLCDFNFTLEMERKVIGNDFEMIHSVLLGDDPEEQNVNQLANDTMEKKGMIHGKRRILKCGHGMKNKEIPIVIDSGETYSITPFKEDIEYVWEINVSKVQ